MNRDCCNMVMLPENAEVKINDRTHLGVWCKGNTISVADVNQVLVVKKIENVINQPDRVWYCIEAVMKELIQVNLEQRFVEVISYEYDIKSGHTGNTQNIQQLSS